MTSGQLLKRAMGGKLDFMSAAQRAWRSHPQAGPALPAELQQADVAVQALKQAILVVAGAGAMA